MDARRYIEDCEFERLVRLLQMVVETAESGPVERWEIRIALAEHGILPQHMADERDTAAFGALAAALRRPRAA